jgi:hypothetical protein
MQACFRKVSCKTATAAAGQDCLQFHLAWSKTVQCQGGRVWIKVFRHSAWAQQHMQAAGDGVSCCKIRCSHFLKVSPGVQTEEAACQVQQTRISRSCAVITAGCCIDPSNSTLPILPLLRPQLVEAAAI